MYLDYSRLWKLLIDKNLNKMDLIELTGISSRVIAKLTRNETVTTDTLARICAALECNLEDIAECCKEKPRNLYTHLKKNGNVTEDCETYRLSELSVDGTDYIVYQCKIASNKGSHIICGADGTVYLEQFYPFGGLSSPIKSKATLMKPGVFRNAATLVVIKGKPAMIRGLDEGVFASHRQHKLPEKNRVTVLSEAELKLVEISEDVTV